MKLLIYLEQPKILKLMKSKYQANPGVGGTTFTAARLAIGLEEEIKKFKHNIELFITTDTKEYCSFHDIRVIPIDSITNFKFDCAIITGDLIDAIYKNEILIKSERFISCIRHPYDYDKISKSKKIKAEIVSVSKSCYLSNFLISGPHNQIDNIFNGERIRKSLSSYPISIEEIISNKKNSNYLNIGYLGALVTSKGFHHLVKRWSNLSNYFRERNIFLRLDVIGGSNLYEFEESHQNLPCSKKYGDLIESYIGDELDKSVFFHGTLGLERYDLMQRCDLAVVNPTGSGEAFCASILEWYSLGIPVISSLNYGMSDMMRYFDNLTIKNPTQINQKIIYFKNLDIKKKKEIKLKCLYISKYFSSQENLILQKWLLLINNPNIFVKEYKNLTIFFGAIINLIRFLRISFSTFLKNSLRKIFNLQN